MFYYILTYIENYIKNIFFIFRLSTYKREIDRLKTENREVRARGSVAERGYRAVMAENERLCNKLEHLEEIFVHQGLFHLKFFFFLLLYFFFSFLYISLC